MRVKSSEGQVIRPGGSGRAALDARSHPQLTHTQVADDEQWDPGQLCDNVYRWKSYARADFGYKTGTAQPFADCNVLT